MTNGHWDEEFAQQVGALPTAVEFSEHYKEDFTPEQAAKDAQTLAGLTAERPMAMELLQSVDGDSADARLRIVSSSGDLTLSKAMPHLQQLGVDVVDERPYEVKAGEGRGKVYSFGVNVPGGREHFASLSDDDRARITEAFRSAYAGESESDKLNQLVLVAGLSTEQVTWLRAISRYLQQATVVYTQDSIAEALVANAEIAKHLVDIFAMKFDPAAGGDAESRKPALEAEFARLDEELKAVASLEHDQIIRYYRDFLKAAIRTNAYQEDRPALAIKLLPRELDFLPEPRPMFEITVYSPRVAGVHLRYGMVARGGLRWSDRRDDFRTEILGLVKAQMVKNTVIVPVGAKGGFYPKHLPNPAVDRKAWQEEGIACYKIFITSLLTVTDNIVKGEIVPPKNVVRYDGDDPYLVVAADKGTATFSDIANGISLERGHWLGDAFASGGSIGYDHKGMGITARGAWESVKRHFRELGIDCQNEDFTCIGIGDMAGDVFGNGALLSKHNKLVGAFNHIHIFLDPTPNPEVAWNERKRMFDNRLGWDQYDKSLISAGGGVYERSAKSIEITPQVREVLGLDEGVTSMTPTELIHAMLQAPVDLIYNGGIGTYLKATFETHAQVGDKANDALRVNGDQIRAKIFGEGGNLGCTQLGRIEYAQHGGKINTDFIDNSAGVDTSDHEVNIKILFAQEIEAGRATMEERNATLPTMTDEVAQLVLSHNISQNRCLQAANLNAERFTGIHEDWMKVLEDSGYMDRKVQFMPTSEEMKKRMVDGRGLTNPELCTLLAWTKIKLEDDALASDLPDDPYLDHVLVEYFPTALREKYHEAMKNHRLKREIITTEVVNKFVDTQGITAFHRMSMESGAGVAEVMRGQIAANAIFDGDAYAAKVAEQKIDAATSIDLRMEIRKAVERGARWLISNRPSPLDIRATIDAYHDDTQQLRAMRGLLAGRGAEHQEATKQSYLDRGVAEDLAQAAAEAQFLPVCLQIAQIAKGSGRDLETVAKVYFAMGEKLALDTMMEKVQALPRVDRWDAMSRSAVRDDLMAVHSQLTGDALATAPQSHDVDEILQAWAEQVGDVDNKATMLADIVDSEPSLSRIMVGMRIVRSMLKPMA